ncbi:hypothetical protein C8A01DRAFT_50966 [Parachaetomium inaequale]|uniref:F-box domain-containing protein n=1 Tax=Parachaetomium inaequale TaxID=2588326 RepID=A0AAN6SLY1_9PEZI|nr:hypothetical protein C8A01DRAFT_50966 [Parachaetomium inaequale]
MSCACSTVPVLLQHPNEILFLIAGSLDSKSLCNLRLVSRNLNGVALPAISKRCFETRYVMLQQYSLESLIEISRHPVFGPALMKLTICIDHLTEDPENNRARNMVDDALKPWGATALMRQTGLTLTNAIERLDSIEFVEQTLRDILLAIVASITSLYELDIAPGRFNGDGISPDMLVFPSPVLRYIRSHAVSLTSLSGSWVTDLLGFIALFPRLQRLSLEFDPVDEHEHFPELSQRLRFQGLQFLGIFGVECTDGELAALLLGHKDTLEEAYLSSMDIIAEGGSWQALLATVQDELSGKEVYYHKRESDGATFLDRFKIGRTMQSWTDTINGIVIGDREKATS